MSSPADILKRPQMAFEPFELVGLLRVRPRVSQQHSKGKRGSLLWIRSELPHACASSVLSVDTLTGVPASPIVPTCLLAVETKDSFALWLAKFKYQNTCL